MCGGQLLNLHVFLLSRTDFRFVEPLVCSHCSIYYHSGLFMPIIFSLVLLGRHTPLVGGVVF